MIEMEKLLGCFVFNSARSLRGHSKYFRSNYINFIPLPLLRFCTFWWIPSSSVRTFKPSPLSRLNISIYCLPYFFQRSQNLMHNREIQNPELRFFMLRKILPVQCLKDSFIYLGVFASNKGLKIIWTYVCSWKRPPSPCTFSYAFLGTYFLNGP